MIDLLKTLSEFCSDRALATLPPDVTGRLQSAILDGIASMLAGVGEPVSLQVFTAVGMAARAGTSPGDCTIVGFAQKTNLRDAALINGTIAHACDYDDSSWTMWGHPTAPLLPALLACAEQWHSSGREVLSAFAAGLEVEKVLGLLMQPEHYRRGWHPTATLGLFGAVAGAGRLFGMTSAEFRSAFGIAASMAAGLRSNAGYGAKPLHTGLAARNGIEAVLLAKCGVTSNPDALDGDGGVFAIYGAAPDRRVEQAVNRLGNPFEVIDPGLSPKLYPCCSDIHCAIDIVLDERTTHGFGPADVAAVRCFVAPMAEPNVRRREPQTPVEAKFSMSYCIGCALVLGRVGLEQFKETALSNTDVRVVEARVTVEVDASLGETESFSSPAIVEIDLKDGRRLRTFLSEMRGHPKRPLSAEEMRSKFFQCADGVLRAEESKPLYEAIQRFDAMPDIVGLMALMAGREARADVA